MRMHGLASEHKRSINNPGDANPSLVDAEYAYRTALCGQVRYCKSDGEGGWRWQDGRFMAVDAGDPRVTCLTCGKLAEGRK